MPKESRFGELPPRYRFMLNPYPDQRNASDFVEYYRELRVARPGWYKADQEPPEMEPPPSQEWVKPGSKD